MTQQSLVVSELARDGGGGKEKIFSPPFFFFLCHREDCQGWGVWEGGEKRRGERGTLVLTSASYSSSVIHKPYSTGGRAGGQLRKKRGEEGGGGKKGRPQVVGSGVTIPSHIGGTTTGFGR